MNDYLKAIRLLEKKFLNKYIFSNFLITVGSFFELVSIGLIIPLFYFLQDIENNIDKVNNFLGYELILDNLNRTTLVLILVLLFLFFYFVKSIYLIFIFAYTRKFINKHEQFLSEKVYSNYVLSDFIESTNKDRSKTFRNIHEVSAHSACMQSILVLNQEILTFFFIFSGIFVLDIKIGASLLLLSIVLIIFFNFFTKRKLKFLGERKRELESQNLTNVLDALGSLKEIKIFQKENFFINEFAKLKKNMLNNMFKSDFFSFFPRFLIELFVLSSFVIYFVFTYIEVQDLDVVIPKIIFLIMVGFRVLPGINRIILNVQTLRKNSASITNIYAEKIQSKKIEIFNKDKNLIFKNDIKFQNLDFEYGKNGKIILKDINIRIQKGDIVGIFGNSGSGKTTFINLCLGLIKPTKGLINIDDRYDLFENSSLWHKFISFVPQKIFMKNASITKNIAFAVNEDLINEKKINDLINICNLDNFVENKKEADQIFIGDDAIKISGGQAQRIGIARGLYKNAEVLILDEATNNLDEKNEQEIISKIKNLFKKDKKTGIIVSHSLEMLKKNCDYIFHFKNQTISKYEQ